MVYAIIEYIVAQWLYLFVWALQLIIIIMLTYLKVLDF